MFKFRRIKEKIVNLFHKKQPHKKQPKETFIDFKTSPFEIETETKSILSNNRLMETIRKARAEISGSKPYEPLAEKEEQARKMWLPEPTRKIRITTRIHQPPAERHRDAISKAMKGKGRMSRFARRTMKRSSTIRIEEETDAD